MRRSLVALGLALAVSTVQGKAPHVPTIDEIIGLERPGGTVNGPVFMAAADCAMWLAIKRHIGIEQDAVTSELNTAFLNAARRQTVYCTARVLKLGKRSIYGTAECHDGKGRLFTHHTITYARLARAQPAP